MANSFQIGCCQGNWTEGVTEGANGSIETGPDDVVGPSAVEGRYLTSKSREPPDKSNGKNTGMSGEKSFHPDEGRFQAQ